MISKNFIEGGRDVGILYLGPFQKIKVFDGLDVVDRVKRVDVVYLGGLGKQKFLNKDQSDLIRM